MNETASLLARTAAVQQQALADGLRWREPHSSNEDIARWLRDEIDEFLAAATPAEQQDELGDILMFAVRLGWTNGIAADAALDGALGKFEERLARVRALALERHGVPLSEVPVDGVGELWRRAKAELRARAAAGDGRD